MADSKISQLPSAAVPLAGTELIPVVQAGVTDSVSIANLTKGRSVSAADYVMTVGNLVPTANKGVNFTANTPAAGMTNQLLNWYEEGVWTPSLIPSTSGSISLSTANGKYIRIGSMVTIVAFVSVNAVVAPTGELRLSGLPFIISAGGGGSFSPFAFGLAASATTSLVGNPSSTNTYAVISKYASGGVSNLASDVQIGTGMFISFSYFV